MSVTLPSLLRAEIYLRWNQAGYRTDHPKSIVVMSDSNLAGRAWRMERVEGDRTPVASGRIGRRSTGKGDHTPFAYNHVIDFSAVRQPGLYRFFTDGLPAPIEIRINDAPYSRLLHEPLQHLRLMRSGSHETRLRTFSHPGDARAPVFVPDGDPARGKWFAAEPARTVDALGGWYDAGDQIKFTLNIAYTTYHLLLAWSLDPARFNKIHSRSDLPDVLDEARHGLEYLARTYPSESTFIIQVGNELDHEQGLRLPEHDKLDGQRPALCALSRVHMGATTAALALGARILQEHGRTDEASVYAAKAIAIHARAGRPDALKTAFERGSVNDFYHDATDVDQRALAAAELYFLTNDGKYLEEGRTLAPPPAPEVGWGNWNWLANSALASAGDAQALERWLSETGRYTRRGASRGRPWYVPGRYVWASLHRWVGIANACRLASLRGDGSDERDAVFFGMLDYVFGRNNWGVSFLHSEQLPNTLRHPYSPAYGFLRVFPTGVFSEGPGDRRQHEELARYFRIPPGDPLERFNTPAAVFHDDASDFMCQEATITGQADAMLLLTLAALGEPAENP